MLVFYTVVLTRLFGACDACSSFQTRCAVVLFAVGDRQCWRRHDESGGVLSEAVRSMGWQLRLQPLRVRVLGGILELDYPLFGAMLAIVVTYTVILMQFQQDEGDFAAVDDIY